MFFFQLALGDVDRIALEAGVARLELRVFDASDELELARHAVKVRAALGRIRFVGRTFQGLRRTELIRRMPRNERIIVIIEIIWLVHTERGGLAPQALSGSNRLPTGACALDRITFQRRPQGPVTAFARGLPA